MTNVLSSRSWIWQIVGFSLGVWLFWTVLQGAVQAGDFSALRDADPMLLVLMLVLSLASSVCNAALFTSVSRPLQHQPSLSLQRMVPLNFSWAHSTTPLSDWAHSRESRGTSVWMA